MSKAQWKEAFGGFSKSFFTALTQGCEGNGLMVFLLQFTGKLDFPVVHGSILLGTPLEEMLVRFLVLLYLHLHPPAGSSSSQPQDYPGLPSFLVQAPVSTHSTDLSALIVERSILLARVLLQLGRLQKPRNLRYSSTHITNPGHSKVLAHRGFSIVLWIRSLSTA